MKTVLIVLAVMQGIILYGFAGFGVFLIAEKIYGDDWRETWNDGDDGESAVMAFLAFWPFLLAIGIVVSPFYLVYTVIDKMAHRGGDDDE